MAVESHTQRGQPVLELDGGVGWAVGSFGGGGALPVFPHKYSYRQPGRLTLSVPHS